MSGTISQAPIPTREALVEAIKPFGTNAAKKLTEIFNWLDQIVRTDGQGEQEAKISPEHEEAVVNYARSIFAAKGLLASSEISNSDIAVIDGMDKEGLNLTLNDIATEAIATVFTGVGEKLIKGNAIDHEGLIAVAKIISDAVPSENGTGTVADLLNALGGAGDLAGLKTILGQHLPNLNAKALGALKIQMGNWINLLKNNPALLLIKHLNQKENKAMTAALANLLKNPQADEVEDPRLEPEEFKKLQTELATIIQEARTNPNANLVPLYTRKLAELKLPAALVKDMYQAMIDHSKQSPEAQEQSLDFMGSIVDKLKESAPYALVPALVSLCMSMVSWIPLVGPPVAQLASSITQPLISVMVAQMASNRAQPPAAKPVT